ncbi:MAG: spore protease YyaC [Bacillota bacterium]|jgi:putative sporulation protein YyaC
MTKKHSAPQHFARVKYSHPDAASIICQALLALYRQPIVTPEEILVLCIGTDRSTGDSLGPLIGTKLIESRAPFSVLGCLEHPIHAANLAQTLEQIQEKPPGWTVAIDASLGNIDGVGTVNIGAGSLQPGAGVNKNLPQVGDVYITGVVNVGGFMEYFVLQNTRLSLVVKMAEVICAGLLAAFSVPEVKAGHR